MSAIIKIFKFQEVIKIQKIIITKIKMKARKNGLFNYLDAFEKYKLY